MFNTALVRVLAAEDEYCIAYGDDIETAEKGDLAVYGDPAEFIVEGQDLLCFMTGEEDEGVPVSVHRVRDSFSVTPDDVDFQSPEGEADEEADDELEEELEEEEGETPTET